MRHVLLIEDHTEIQDLVKIHLREANFKVSCAIDGESGLALFEDQQIDLVVLDLMLPGIDGLEVCRRLRAVSPRMPILMLTAKSSEFDRVLGLEVGADDYLTKPFSVRELVARVRALLRRVEKAESQPEYEVKAIGALTIDQARRLVTVEGSTVDLTAKEFDLLSHFVGRPGVVFTRSQLLDSVWGYGHDGYEHTVNSHINRLRGKIEPDSNNPSYVLTVWGVGYRFFDPRMDQAEEIKDQ